RLYRSGDLARRLADGDHEYLGRIDHQVKIRGFRIEPGEIEAALATYPGVREAVVLAREDGESGERRLVAYLGAAAEPDQDGLRAHLAARLPDYMLPAAVVTLPSLPLTANGKIDRAALPAPAAVRRDRAGHREPETALEQALAGLFREVLKIDRVGVEDDFFALGGSSISGAMLINRLQRELGEIVQVVVIFDHPTVGKLAAYLREQHPAALARWLPAEAPAGTGAAGTAAGRVDAAMVERMRELIPPFPAMPEPAAKNPPALFVLAPPRSGTTLLRVMLGGHPRLFAPPELELLSFPTLADRRAAFTGRDSFWLEGLLRALKELRGGTTEEARAWVEEHERRQTPTLEIYGLLQQELAGRWLVDKTPSYALDPAVLRRAETGFREPRYLHLVRHPCGMIRSFEEAKLDQVFFRRAHPFTRRQLAELIWLISHQNILELLSGVPAGRQHTVRFEELLAAPERVLRGVCDFLGLEYHPDMARPYEGGAARMTDGLHAESRMLGDVKFHQHSRVAAEVAERWRAELSEADLGQPARRVATALGYPLGAEWARIERGAWSPGEPLPLSFAQERLWFLDQLHPGTSTYNIPLALRLTGELDIACLQAALTEVTRRHAVLRTSFVAIEGRPVQVVGAVETVPLPLVDLTGLPAAGREAEALRLVEEEERRPFDLARGPLLRVAVVRLSGGEHVALVNMHHIASDGWSVGVLVRELVALWPALSRREPSPLPEPVIQYVDFALWQRAWLTPERLAEDLEGWRRRLAGLPALELPTDRPRPPFPSGQGASLTFALPPALSLGLAAAGRRTGTTLFMTTLAGFWALLGRVTGQDDFAVGTPVAGRHHAELEGLIGFFVNTLVLRLDLQGSPRFDEALGQVRRIVLEAFAHQEVPFERVVEDLQPQRDLSRPPLFQVMFALQNAASERLELSGLRLQLIPQEVTAAKFELTLSLAETPAGLSGTIEYAIDLFDRATISRLAGHFATLLAAAVAAPSSPVAELPLLGAAERQQLVLEWNDTAVVRDGAAVCIHELFERQVAQRPQALAVVGQGRMLSYGELEAQANRLARRLRRAGVGPEVRVATSLPRSPMGVVALLAVLKAGGAWVALDPLYPRERRAWMLEDSGARVLVTLEALRDELPALPAVEVLCLDRAGDADEDSSRPVGWALPEGLAYVIYTSGSTGLPKGVGVEQAAAASHLQTAAEAYGLRPGDRTLQTAAWSFDIAIEQLLAPLAAGATLVFWEGDLAPRELMPQIVAAGTTFLDLPPAFLHLWVQEAAAESGPVPAVHTVLVGGEALSPEVARRWPETPLRHARLLNCYGPTEAVITATVHAVGIGESLPSVPIGGPLRGRSAYVLDRHGCFLPVGVPGELCLGGVLARGYLGRPEATAERFVPDSSSAVPGARVYRTGDRVRWLPAGELEFLGRIDQQVKVRGFRVELGEIEAALAAHPAVREAVVLSRKDLPGGSGLVACFVADGPGEEWVRQLRRWLEERLPGYMVPAAFVHLEALPQTPNGKVDRRALERIALQKEPQAEGMAAPRTLTEELLAGIWTQVLGLERVSVEESFFELGGHSLLATQVMSRIQEVFGVILPLRALFDDPTVAGLASRVSAALAGGERAPIPPIERVPRDRPLPL
ncbi:MAG TPA: amino acid adenylation domain-containing protein, partial [Thermoanaerobaculia bacterium]|nr:amino acid adenylation domain-containing protein [Thermoanaerobaculia bacterium]